MTAPLRPILYAEDSPHDVEMTLETLAEHQIANEVIVVSDGQEALDYLHGTGKFSGQPPGNPLLALLDLKMPRVDGLAVLRAIKGDPKLQHIPAVMLTSSREEADLVRSYELGVNAYIVKPVSVAAFVEAVRQLSVFWAVHNVTPPPHAPPSPPSSLPP